jgi:hypothetical protein
MVSFQILRANIEAAERIDESADDITAADTAPSPENSLLRKMLE